MGMSMGPRYVGSQGVPLASHGAGFGSGGGGGGGAFAAFPSFAPRPGSSASGSAPTSRESSPSQAPVSGMLSAASGAGLAVNAPHPDSPPSLGPVRYSAFAPGSQTQAQAQHLPLFRPQGPSTSLFTKNVYLDGW